MIGPCTGRQRNGRRRGSVCPTTARSFKCGEFLISSSRDCPKSWIFRTLDCELAQSESYPKLCTLTLRRPGSVGSQNCGQNSRWSIPLRHVLIEPPRNPWTKMRSMSGSGEGWRSLSPSRPRVPSSAWTSLRFLPQEAVKRFLRNVFERLFPSEVLLEVISDGGLLDAGELSCERSVVALLVLRLWRTGRALSAPCSPQVSKYLGPLNVHRLDV